MTLRDDGRDGVHPLGADTGLAAVLVVAASPDATAVEVVGQLVASELRAEPGLVRVLTLPGVGEGVRFERSHNSQGSECVGRVFESIQDFPFSVSEIGEYFAARVTCAWN